MGRCASAAGMRFTTEATEHTELTFEQSEVTFLVVPHQ